MGYRIIAVSLWGAGELASNFEEQRELIFLEADLAFVLQHCLAECESEMYSCVWTFETFEGHFSETTGPSPPFYPSLQNQCILRFAMHLRDDSSDFYFSKMGQKCFSCMKIVAPTSMKTILQDLQLHQGLCPESIKLVCYSLALIAVHMYKTLVT